MVKPTDDLKRRIDAAIAKHGIDTSGWLTRMSLNDLIKLRIEYKKLMLEARFKEQYIIAFTLKVIHTEIKQVLNYRLFTELELMGGFGFDDKLVFGPGGFVGSDRGRGSSERVGEGPVRLAP